jgi:single-strand DNA-binding protein
MSSVNKAIIIGNLGAEPELRKTPGGKSVANFNVATNESYTDSDGQKHEHTEWHTIVTWNKLAENCSQYLKKGSNVYVEGRIRTRTWDDQEGNKHYRQEIIAAEVRFLDKKPSDQ